MRVFVLGAGRAGRGLAVALRAAGVDIAGLHGRRPSAGPPPVTAGPRPPALATADVILVTVRDAQLSDALAGLRPAGLAARAVVLHASGGLDPRAALEDLRAHGHPSGTFHPLVPLAEPERAPALLRGAWIGVEGDAGAREAAAALADRLGAHVLAIPAANRAAYHAAAVMASNFPVVLAETAASLLQRGGIDGAVARAAVRHLMGAALLNLETAGDRVPLTGPVSRGDPDTVAAHLAALASDPDTSNLYRALSVAAIPLAAAQGADPGQLQRIRALLGVSSSR